ncbi:MAG: zinc ribbon domain-containing protein [Victivallales bacterium]|nr:zinc ribbon domain-containing protein [Victivallales bacterium]
MPNYDYECPHCNKNFEIFQNMSAERLKVCPDCGKSGLKRLIGSGAGIIFKGSGFYCTDYRSSSYEKDRQKDLAVSGKCDKCPQKDSSCPQKTAQGTE